MVIGHSIVFTWALKAKKTVTFVVYNPAILYFPSSKADSYPHHQPTSRYSKATLIITHRKKNDPLIIFKIQKFHHFMPRFYRKGIVVILYNSFVQMYWIIYLFFIEFLIIWV